MCAEELPSAVGHAGMGVHDPAGKLHQFADMSDQQHLFHSLQHCQVQRVPDIVGALDPWDFLQFRHLLLQEVKAVVSRAEDQTPAPGSRFLPDLQCDGVDNGLLAHGLDDPRRPQNRDSSLDAEHGVKGLFRDLPALRRGDQHLQAPRIAQLVTDRLHCAADHAPRYGVDGRFPHRPVETRSGHPADPFSAVDREPVSILADRRDDQDPVRHIGVVPGILAHGAKRPLPLHAAEDRLRLDPQSAGCEQGQRLRGSSREQQLRGSRGRHSCAAPGGIAAAQPLASAADVVFKAHGVFSRFAASAASSGKRRRIAS